MLTSPDHDIRTAPDTQDTSGPAALRLWDAGRASVVVHPSHADARTGVVCLSALGFGYRAAAVAFTAGGGWRSVTLLESADPETVARGGIELTPCGVLDLLRVGWATRPGALLFNR